jgi:hypothetical protein
MHMRTKHMGVRLIGMANKTSYLGCPWALPNDLKHNEAGSSTISTGWLRLRVAQTPRSRDQAIFVLTTDNRQTDTQTYCFTPAVHARMRGNDRLGAWHSEATNMTQTCSHTVTLRWCTTLISLLLYSYQQQWQPCIQSFRGYWQCIYVSTTF